MRKCITKRALKRSPLNIYWNVSQYHRCCITLDFSCKNWCKSQMQTFISHQCFMQHLIRAIRIDMNRPVTEWWGNELTNEIITSGNTWFVIDRSLSLLTLKISPSSADPSAWHKESIKAATITKPGPIILATTFRVSSSWNNLRKHFRDSDSQEVQQSLHTESEVFLLLSCPKCPKQSWMLARERSWDDREGSREDSWQRGHSACSGWKLAIFVSLISVKRYLRYVWECLPPHPSQIQGVNPTLLKSSMYNEAKHLPSKLCES